MIRITLSKFKTRSFFFVFKNVKCSICTGFPEKKKLEFNNLGKKKEKTWNLRSLEKPGIFNKKPRIFNNFNMISSKISI